MKTLSLSFILAVAAAPAFAADAAQKAALPKGGMGREVAVSVAESVIKWRGAKVTGEHNGTIKLRDGSVRIEGDRVVGGAFAVDMGSIVNEDIAAPEWNKKLVTHLISEDFFAAEQHPVSTFTITRVTPLVRAEEGSTHTVSGDLTIRGVTQPVSFPAKVSVGEKAAEATAVVKLDRTRWGLRYGSGKFFQGLGDKMIHDEFTLELALTAPLAQPKPAK